ncbi:carbohydrate esterase family 3 protein [Myriangium duriaei CBS 260.36]|uniref:Carbohydrate esterase family 3 protein n=1 Tax=Myriangium duriaei CBS 260.36 TaxID=1168546 RepID=A0A9P4MRK8_9PEZI|nr:carbohydrate esterase family 3 protein [Myriangium duriaei CBS 260.36]
MSNSTCTTITSLTCPVASHALYTSDTNTHYRADMLLNRNLQGTQPPQPGKCIVATPRAPPPTPRQYAKTLTYLAMGDSITMGYLADECYNSYRLPMINLLTGTTPLWTTQQHAAPSAMYQVVKAVGSINSGNFTENASEGFDGGEINTIRDNWLARKSTYTATPDIVTILAGIHDIGDNPPATAANIALQNLDGLVDRLFQEYPYVTVLVSTLTPVTVDGWKGPVATFNTALPGRVQQRASRGQKILMVDAGAALDVHEDIADFVHPNAQGYVKLARAFYEGLKVAAERHWLPFTGARSAAAKVWLP